jgi:hypothetical protein
MRPSLVSQSSNVGITQYRDQMRSAGEIVIAHPERRWAARRTAGVAHNRREIVEEAFAGKGKYRSANGGTLD